MNIHCQNMVDIGIRWRLNGDSPWVLKAFHALGMMPADGYMFVDMIPDVDT
jgi:hypothetical protein